MNERFITLEAAKLHEVLTKCTMLIVGSIASMTIALWFIEYRLKKLAAHREKSQ